MPAKREIITILMAFVVTTSSVAAQSSAERIIVVTMDGTRWQEVFGGADRRIITSPDGGVSDSSFVLQRFWRDDIEGRRRVLMPFIWGVVARRGMLLGDSTAGSVIRVTNGKRFSYPGYNELFTGVADGRIDSNDKVPNPNVTVVEWLAGRPGFTGSVELYGSWDVFPSIFNVARSKLRMNGDGPPFPVPQTEREKIANQMATWLPNHWVGVRLDAPTMVAAMEALRTRKPRVLVVLLGETDEWAHERRYDLYLDAMRRADRFMEELWNLAQSLPEYRGRTSLLIATDHGRGATGRDWPDHGRDVPAAERIWMAAMGPKVTMTGVRGDQSGTQSQFAATLAMLLGEHWQSARPDAANPLRLTGGR